MIGGTIIHSGDNLNFSRYLYFEIRATIDTSVTYNAITTSLSSGSTINISSGGLYLTFFDSIVSNPDITVKGVVRLSDYVENNPTKPVSFRSGLEPLDACCPFVETPPFDPNDDTFFILTEDDDFITDELDNKLVFN